MNTADIAYYTSFVVTSLLIGLLWWAALKQRFFFRKADGSKVASFTVAATVVGVASAAFGFPGLLSVLSLLGFKSNLGHGESIVAAPVFNLLLAAALIFIGRITLGWKTFRF